MSNIGTKIEKLVSNGFTYNTLRGLNESQIGLYTQGWLNNQQTLIWKKTLRVWMF